MHKTLGIIGGLGPQATVDFVQKVLNHTPVEKDQDHIPMIIHSNCQVPDRIASVKGTGPNAGPVLTQMAKDLAAWGADYLAMPCHTAHYYYPQIKDAVDIPFINMVEETAKTIRDEGITRIGIMATQATIETNLYSDACALQGVEIVKPDEENLGRIVRIISSVKKNDYQVLLKDAETEKIFTHFENAGVSCLLLACTELPIFFSKDHFPDKLFIDATDLLAQKVVAFQV